MQSRCLRSLHARFASAENSRHQVTVFPSLKVFQFTTRSSPRPPRPRGGPCGMSRGAMLCPARHLCSVRAPDQFQFSTSLLGSLNVYLRLKGQTAIENPLWSSSGNKGQHWNQARVNINPPTSFQVMASASLRGAQAPHAGKENVRVLEGGTRVR